MGRCCPPPDAVHARSSCRLTRCWLTSRLPRKPLFFLVSKALVSKAVSTETKVSKALVSSLVSTQTAVFGRYAKRRYADWYARKPPLVDGLPWCVSARHPIQQPPHYRHRHARRFCQDRSWRRPADAVPSRIRMLGPIASRLHGGSA
jgi:hypothetical protein